MSRNFCCNEWSRPDAPLASPALARRRFAKRLLRRMARAGDSDDCGHEREGDPSGGLFAPGNTCAAGGDGERALSPPRDPHPDPDDEEWDPGDEPEESKNEWDRMHERKAAREREEAEQKRQRQQAKAKILAFAERESEPPIPTVSSPRPFLPGKPISQRIDAYRKANPELLDRLISAMEPLVEEIEHHEHGRNQVNRKLDKINTDILYMKFLEVVPSSETTESREESISRLKAEHHIINSATNSTRRRMSEAIDALTGRRGMKGVHFKTTDGIGDWSGNPGQRRAAALEWLRTKVAGVGEIEIKWDYDNSNYLDRAGASTKGSRSSIGVGPMDKPEAFIHEIGHVLESRVTGVHKAAKEFLQHRTADYDDQPMNDFMDEEEDKRYKPEEVGNEDDFRAAFGKYGGYVGKKYKASDHATEIVSMGVEKLYSDPVTFARKDPEYCAFILGLLSGDLRSP